MSIGGQAYLEGNWGPVADEISEHELEIEGDLPRDLEGSFLRIGPNPQFQPKGQYHWFDGDGMVHAVRIAEGKASYRNRYVETKGYCLEKEAQKALWTGLLELPQFDHPHGIRKNVANTALVWHAGKLLALWEGGEPHELSVPSLSTVGPHSFNGMLSSAFTAHPKVDMKTGEMMFFGYSILEQPYVRYGVVGPDGAIKHTTGVELEVPVMMHDFAITEHYTIIMDLPLTFRLERMMEGRMPIAFERDRPSRFGIMPRHGEGKQIRWFEAPASYIFHTFGAYEEGSEVVLLASRMSSADGIVGGESTADQRARAYRYRFDLEKKSCVEEPINDLASDFPRIDDRLMGYKFRFGYAARLKEGEMPYVDGVVKYDFEKGSSESYVYGPGRFGGEAVFAPRKGGETEDDGWILSLMHDEGTGQSKLCVLDARSPAKGPVAQVRMPRRVPYGFHAAWITS